MTWITMVFHFFGLCFCCLLRANELYTWVPLTDDEFSRICKLIRMNNICAYSFLSRFFLRLFIKSCARKDVIDIICWWVKFINYYLLPWVNSTQRWKLELRDTHRLWMCVVEVICIVMEYFSLSSDSFLQPIVCYEKMGGS